MNSNKKICVVQFDNRKNDYLSRIKEINKTYCNLNNYDFFYEDDIDFNNDNYKDLLEFSNEDRFKPMLIASLNKFLIVKKYLNKGYDYVSFVDTDCCFSNPNKRIEEYIDDEHELFLSQDDGLLANIVKVFWCAKSVNEFCVKTNKQYFDFNIEKLKLLNNKDLIQEMMIFITNPNGINTGFIIFKNTEKILKLIDDVYPYIKISEYMSMEQGFLGFLLNSPKYKDILKILPLNFQGNSRITFKDFHYNEDDNFVNHGYGGSYEEKLLGLAETINNKWWQKRIFSNSNIRIFTCFHNKETYPKNIIFNNRYVYQPLLCGSEFIENNIDNISYDNTGKNISKYNKMFGETTGIYWIMNNVDEKTYKFIGISHYRRILDFDIESLDDNKIITYCENYKNKLNETKPSEAEYALPIINKILLERNNKNELDAFNEWINQTEFYGRHLFIMPSKIFFNEYKEFYEYVINFLIKTFNMLPTRIPCGYVCEYASAFWIYYYNFINKDSLNKRNNFITV